jgi:hypothetical protein
MLGDAGLLLDGHDGIGGGHGARAATKGGAAAAASKISRKKNCRAKKKEGDQILIFFRSAIHWVLLEMGLFFPSNIFCSPMVWTVQLDVTHQGSNPGARTFSYIYFEIFRRYALSDKRRSR